MGSLREIKDRIGSVRSTLKITSAMKLVASSKLRKAQKAIEGLRPYEKTLGEILFSLASESKSVLCRPVEVSAEDETHRAGVAVVAISSNSSLCGGFNANVIRKASEVIEGNDVVEVYSLGRKMADAMKKKGFPSREDYSSLVARPSYEAAAALASALQKDFMEGRVSRVVLVYNHFVSNSKQVAVAETYLPFEMPSSMTGEPECADEYIVEPSPSEVVETLLPQVLMLKFYVAILDSAAAEHAARTVAMQTATDNAEDLLGELTLEYNKGRQQKITSEILDLLGGAAE